MKSYLITLLVAALIATFAGGFSVKSIFVFFFLALLLSIDFYFSTRNAAEPTKTETFIANSWVNFRRLVCFMGAFFFLLVIIFVNTDSLSLLQSIGLRAVLLLLVAMCVWVAIYGQGPNRYILKDDVELHRKNKKRYKWRW